MKRLNSICLGINAPGIFCFREYLAGAGEAGPTLFLNFDLIFLVKLVIEKGGANVGLNGIKRKGLTS
jgi:hypothetical protein